MEFCNAVPEGMNADEFREKLVASQKRTAALMIASEKMVEFVNEWCCPHDIVVIEQGRVALYCGNIGFPTKIPD